MMKSALMLLVVFSLIVISTCRNTQCTGWKNSQEWRCAKDNAPADLLEVVSTCSGCEVNFQIGVWTSHCGQHGVEELNRADTVGANLKLYAFPEALPGICREFFFFNCKVGDSKRPCLDVLRVRSVLR